MIARIWHGFTNENDAPVYERMLREEIFPGIESRGIAGFKGLELLRRNLGKEVEFVTVMWFDSLQAIRDFAGEDYERAVIYPAAEKLLTRYDERSQHYEVLS